MKASWQAYDLNMKDWQNSSMAIEWVDRKLKFVGLAELLLGIITSPSSDKAKSLLV